MELRSTTNTLSILRILLLPLLLAAPAARSAGATTIAPPRDLGDLTRASHTVVFAEAVESWVEDGPTIPSTVTRFLLVRQVAGTPVGASFEVQAPGGDAGSRAAAVPGSPRFVEGSGYLLFLDRATDGRWRSKTMAYGILEEIGSTGLLAPLPETRKVAPLQGRRVEPLGVYKKEALLGHLSEVARGAAWNRRRVVAEPLVSSAFEPVHAGPAECKYLKDATTGAPIRWFDFETAARTMTVAATTPGQDGFADGGAGAVQAGVAAWNGHRDSAMALAYGGTRPRSVVCSQEFDVDQGAVVFNDPCDDLADLSPDCVGTLAFGGALYDDSKTRSHDGEAWHPALSSFVVVNDGAECVGATSFQEMMSHEIGHGLGFGHHAPADPADALMSSQLKADGLGAALRPTDRLCASFTYHTFLDVPATNAFWASIEAIENAGITKGCSVGWYCPGKSVARAEMAVFLVRGSHGAGFEPPPATGTIFEDVPAGYWAAAHIEQLYRDGITKGCGSGYYCPGELVERAEMAVFLVRVRHGASYQPPPATGTIFEDVPAGYWAAAHIEQLFHDGITKGCSASPRRYCPTGEVSRDQMAAFLARAFELPLP